MIIASRPVGVWAVFALLCSVSSAWAAPDARCLGFFRAKKYLKSGECYESVAQALGQSQNLPTSKRNYKGRMLRNAALAFRKHAKATPAEAVKWRLHALKLLQQYQREKLCETPERCRMTLAMARSIRTQVGFTLVVITTGHPKAQVELVGTHFQKKGEGERLKWKVPPGAYVVTVTTPLRQGRSKKLKVVANTPALVSFAKPRIRVPMRAPQPRKPKPKPKSNIAPWVVTGGGALIAIVGGIVLIAGLAQESALHQEAASLRQKVDASHPQTTDLMTRHGQNGILFPVGWGALAAGGAGAVVGLIWGLASSPKASP